MPAPFGAPWAWPWPLPIHDAHHFGAVVHDMDNAWLGAPPPNMQLVMNVHYSRNYENAFWNGSSINFGDGAGFFYPAHRAGRDQPRDQPRLHRAALDPAVLRPAAEYRDRGANDRLVGAHIPKTDPALCRVCTVGKDGASIDNASQHYRGLDVHYSSGVYNKAFCTLAKSSNWNTREAFEVLERANALYWTATATFDSGACGVENSVGDYGYARSDAAGAFNAVDVTCP